MLLGGALVGAGVVGSGVGAGVVGSGVGNAVVGSGVGFDDGDDVGFDVVGFDVGNDDGTEDDGTEVGEPVGSVAFDGADVGVSECIENALSTSELGLEVGVILKYILPISLSRRRS